MRNMNLTYSVFSLVKFVKMSGGKSWSLFNGINLQNTITVYKLYSYMPL